MQLQNSEAMSNLVPVTTQILAPAAILAAGLALMMGAPTDAWLTAIRVVAGVFVLPIALVGAAALFQVWWLRRQGKVSEPGERESALAALFE